MYVFFGTMSICLLCRILCCILQFLYSFIFCYWGAFLVSQMVKNLPGMQETPVRSLGQKDPLEKEMAAYSSILAWRIPWTEEPGGLQSMGLQRVGHNWVTYIELYKLHINFEYSTLSVSWFPHIFFHSIICFYIWLLTLLSRNFLVGYTLSS